MSIFKRLAGRSGSALTELVIAITLSTIMLGSIFALYTNGKDKATMTKAEQGLFDAVENIRTYYMFEGSYAGISSLTAEDFYTKDFFQRSWVCSGEKTIVCKGPGDIQVSFTGTTKKFKMSLKNLTEAQCLTLSQIDYHNVHSVKINKTTFTPPIATSDVVTNCSLAKRKNVITTTLY